jgi:cyclic-di-GMP-binding biofilm dispersal mediator protein
VVLAGRSNERLAGVGIPDVAHVEFDIRDSRAGDRLIEVAHARHGRLDGVVNAAGVVAFGSITDTDDVVIEELFLTNVVGPLWVIRRVAPALAASNGFLVNISAVVAEQPLAGMTAYSASKAAMTAADRALTRELRRQGIHVCDVRPPHTETDLSRHPLAGTAPRLPVGLRPADVAARIVEAIEADETDVASADFVSRETADRPG